MNQKRRINLLFFSTCFLYYVCYFKYGDTMKRVLFKSFVYIMIGFVFGIIVFDNNYFQEFFIKKNTYYFLQEGIYQDVSHDNNDLVSKIVIEEDNNYAIYVGITKNREVAEKIKNIYELKGIRINILQKNIPKSLFDKNILEYDKLLKATNNSNTILTIEEIVLANYEKILNNSS